MRIRSVLPLLATPGQNAAHAFQGFVTVDDATGEPVAAIGRAHLVNGNGWPAVDANEGVTLDDFVFGTPGGVASTTTTTVLPTTTTLPSVCGAAARGDCRLPTRSGKATLVVKDGAADAKDRLVWTWAKGAATAVGDFGDPTAAADYVLCLWDTTGLGLVATAPAGGTCGGKACWKSASSGFRYEDEELTPDGLLAVTLKAGAAGKARVAATGKGAALRVPAPPLATPVAVLLVRGDGGACWGASFATAGKNAAGLFKAKSD